MKEFKIVIHNIVNKIWLGNRYINIKLGNTKVHNRIYKPIQIFELDAYGNITEYII